MPEGWRMEYLGNVCLSSAFGPRFSGECYSNSGNVATLRTTDIYDDGRINYSTMPFAQLDLSQFESHLLHQKDLLITRSGTCGIAAIFEAFEKPVLPGAFLIRFRLTDEINPYFLRYYVNSHAGKSRVLQLASGAIQKNLTGTSLRSFTFPSPPLTEQHAIVAIFQTCDSKIAALEKEITFQEELFRALLEELMSGRLSALPLVE